MPRWMVYALLGYLSGSILFARIAVGFFGKDGAIEASPDGNPGAANAFAAGFDCGMVTLIGDIGKGFLPVFLYLRGMTGFPPAEAHLALILAAPVLGHAFPIFYHFKGGKGIAVSFGCLLGLLPMWQPVITLAACFLTFSLILRITPNFYRTAVTYPCTLLLMYLTRQNSSVTMGFLLITTVVCLRLHLSSETREQMETKWIWMH